LKDYTVKRVSLRHRRRNRNRDLNPIRRAEIIRHAIYVGAAETDDFSRWLLMLALHNPGAKDQVYYLMRTAERLGGRITQADAIAIADEAADIPHCWSADRVAKYLGITYQQRTRLRIRTIGACDSSKRARKARRRLNDRAYQERKRRERGARPQSESLSATQPWRELGMSRRTWERHRNKARDANDATSSAVNLCILADGPATPDGGAGPSERGFASKEARGLPSSQTATTMAVDRYASLPLELRLAALGLPIPENLARAA
jgi:hypothetical protein